MREKNGVAAAECEIQQTDPYEADRDAIREYEGIHGKGRGENICVKPISIAWRTHGLD